MKRIISILTIISVVLSSGLAYAITVDESIINVLNEGETYINGEIRTDISDIMDVGNGYLVYKEENGVKERCFTEDFINFKPVEVFDAHGNRDFYVQAEWTRAGHMDEIKWANGVYMARSNVYDNEMYPGWVLESEGYLYILDKDFQYIKRITFASYVREISYIDGIYYVRITNRGYLRAMVWGSTSEDVIEGVYSSTDLENWKEEPDLQRVPVTNGKTVLTMSNDNVYTFKDGRLDNQIIYEEVKTNYIAGNDVYSQQILNTTGEYFYIYDSSRKYGDPMAIWLSNDGIYMTKYQVDTLNLKSINGSLLDGYEESYMSKNDIDRYLQTSDIYVRLNDKILGFAQPPVMENDRTLVPMRFLFEQMGADVNWNDSTQTATATINSARGGGGERNRAGEIQNSVTFAIDNTTAAVNGKEATMDVPARLINDQTFVPLRFLSENLGYNVEWDESANTAIITTD